VRDLAGQYVSTTLRVSSGRRPMSS
jgi:hypothetical protein